MMKLVGQKPARNMEIGLKPPIRYSLNYMATYRGVIMNYYKIYQQVLEKHGTFVLPETKDYYERHHILPKCVGGKDEVANLIYLPARAHLIAHHLLCRFDSTYVLRIAYQLMSKDGKLNGERYADAKSANGTVGLSVKVHTPLGWFLSVRSAARAHKIHTSMISSRARSKKINHKAYYYDKPPVNFINNAGKHRRKRVHTPLGWFDGVREAAKILKVHHSTIAKRVRTQEDYFYEDADCGIKVKSAPRKVHTPLGWFDSVAMAAKAHDSYPGTISARCKRCNEGYYYSTQV